jgi:hypothetical protein
MRRLVAFLLTWYAVSFFLTSPGNAQGTLAAEVNDKTTPVRVAQLTWNAMTTTCTRSELPTPSVFLAGTITELFKNDDSKRVFSTKRIVFEFRVTGPTSVVPTQLGEADKLNGYQWAGKSELPVTSFRYIDSSQSAANRYNGRPLPPTNPSWSDWEAPRERPYLSLSQKKGQWKVEFSNGTLALFLPHFITDNLLGADFTSGFQYEIGPEYIQRLAKLACSQLTSANPLAGKMGTSESPAQVE